MCVCGGGGGGGGGRGLEGQMRMYLRKKEEIIIHFLIYCQFE